MNISDKGLDLIKQFEGCELRAYLCPAGVWTIGYGSTGKHVKRGMVITEQEAENLLREDVKRFERGVLAALEPTRPLQEEFDAMVSLAFNVGTGAFTKSSVARRYKAGDKIGAANAFLMWNKARVNGKLTVLKGLVRRRTAEKQLFLSAGHKETVARRVEVDAYARLPEESVVPEAPKPLVRSREIILGGGLGIGGVVEMIDLVTTEDLQEAKETVEEMGEASKEYPVAVEHHVPEIAAFLCFGIGMFMIWKRVSDRKKGIR